MVSFNHMVEHVVRLDFIFGSLADATRRDILRRVAKKELSVGEIAKSYSISFAAVSKHLGVLERAKLIVKRQRGKQHYARLAPVALKDANAYLERYRAMWEHRFDRLEHYLANLPNEK